MGLPNSYTFKTGAIPQYFEAIRLAQPPERFSYKFLEGLGFKSTNDRLIVGVLKELGFLDPDGKPTRRYFQFLDKAESKKILAEGIREAFSDLFAVNTEAYKLNTDQIKDKLKTLYAGSKTPLVIGYISKTFKSLSEIADFTETPTEQFEEQDDSDDSEQEGSSSNENSGGTKRLKDIKFGSLQYHINIVLPESRDQGVYDAIFKALKDHL